MVPMAYIDGGGHRRVAKSAGMSDEDWKTSGGSRRRARAKREQMFRGFLNISRSPNAKIELKNETILAD